MINTKLLGEIISKRTELVAEVHVCTVMADFIIANAERCKRERDHCGLAAWNNALRDVNAKLEKVDKEYDEIIERLAAIG